MRVKIYGRALGLALAGVVAIAGVVTASDLKTDLVTSTSSPQRDQALGNVVGGNSSSFTTGVYFSGGHTNVAFSVQEKPAFVTNVTGGTIPDDGLDDAQTSTISWTAPCALGEFSGTVWYKVDSATGSGGFTTDVNGHYPDAFINITGNVTSLGANCATDVYLTRGFYSPVDADGNRAKAGSGVPLKFNVWLNEITIDDEVIDPALDSDSFSISSVKVNCDSGDLDGSVMPTETAGTSSLRYDDLAVVQDADGQYIFVWKTNKDWSGSCRRVEVMYDGERIEIDGSDPTKYLTAEFYFFK